MYIRDLAARTGVAARTIRFYETEGLLPAPARTESGYRRYSEADAARLQFIVGAKTLGLTLEQIREILELRDRGAPCCDQVSHLLEERLSDLDRRIAELVALRDDLRSYKNAVDRDAMASGVDCAHVEGAARGEFRPLSPPPRIGH